MDYFTDYNREREAFSSLLENDCKKRIILYVGQSGTGKTSLLRYCSKNYCYLVDYVPIEFRETMVSIPEIFWRVGDCIGWDSLPVFTKQISDFSGISVNIARNKISGDDNQINVVMNVVNQNAREERRAILTRAFFEDLRKLDQPLLMAMDNYELASSEVKDWISGPYLTRISNTNTVRVALAGREVPDENTIEWGHCSETYELFGIHEAEHWMPVVKDLERAIPVENQLDWLAGICYALDGCPELIIKVIQGLPRLQ